MSYLSMRMREIRAEEDRRRTPQIYRDIERMAALLNDAGYQPQHRIVSPAEYAEKLKSPLWTGRTA